MLTSRDGHKQNHEANFTMNFDQFVVQEPKSMMDFHGLLRQFAWFVLVLGQNRQPHKQLSSWEHYPLLSNFQPLVQILKV